MNVTLETLATLSLLLFVVSSMVSMGLSLTLAEIRVPLSDRRLVGTALLANFVLAPAVAFGITTVLPLHQDIVFGLILLSTAAGAPFLPKLAEVAKGNLASAVGLMVLLMVVTIFYLPLVLPLLIGGVEVQSGRIARALVVLMLLPLSVGLAARARYGEAAKDLQPAFAQAANIGLLLLIALGVLLNFDAMLGFVGSYGILAAILFIVTLLLIGYLLGREGEKRVLGLATAQRNISAALVVAGQNFDLEVVSYLLVVAVIGLLILMPAAGELGRRARIGGPPTS